MRRDGTLVAAPSFLSTAYGSSYARAFPDRQVEVVPLLGRAQGPTSTFQVCDGVATSVTPVAPWDGEGSVPSRADLDRARQRLGVEVLWYPLMSTDVPATRALAAVEGVLVSERRPSPVIDWTCGGRELWSRVRNRLGSRAERRRRAFERAGLRFVDIVEPERAVSFVAEVERRSWKAAAGQDMISREQLALYATLLRDGVLRATAVMDADRPVAFRLDGLAGDTLYCVKWSYDDAYRKTSPGFMLITCDLAERYADAPLARVDLFGGPDSLKDAVTTSSRHRVDIAWPGGVRAAELARCGRAHDARVAVHLAAGGGLRHLYTALAGDDHAAHTCA